MSKNVKSVMERIAEIDKERASLIQEHNETKAKLAEDVRSTPEIVDLVSKVKENNMKIATEIDGMTLTIRPANDTVFATGRGQKYVVTDMSNGNEYRGTQMKLRMRSVTSGLGL